jgi:hypothetical protein
MSVIKKIAFALFFAAAVFTVSAAENCSKANCPDAGKVTNCPVMVTRDLLKAQGAELDETSSDNVFEWWSKGAHRYLVYVGKINVGEKVEFKPATVYTVTIPNDGVCNAGRQITMYHPEGYSKGILSSKVALKLIPGTKADCFKDAGKLLPGTLVAEFEAIELGQTAVAGGEVSGQVSGEIGSQVNCEGDGQDGGKDCSEGGSCCREWTCDRRWI